MQESDSGASQRLVAGRYRLGHISGRGGMGQVWQAVDELIGRPVAVKELRPPAGLGAGERAVVSQRALREARTAGRVHHPGVIAIHDIVPATDDDDAIYIVMELVAAPTLADVLSRDGALPEDRVRTLGLRILAALDAAHQMGVVHRDVKPSNIMVLPGDHVKLIDFGIAHAVGDTRLTRDGMMGSPGYMAPELFHGQESSPASDLWSVGATLCHAITGRSPFDRDSTAATLHAILYDDLPLLDCGRPLAEVITGLLARDAGDRLTSRQAMDLLESAAPPAVELLTVEPSTVEPPTARVPSTTKRVAAKQPTGVRRYGVLGVITALVIVGTIVLVAIMVDGDSSTGTTQSPPSTTARAPLPVQLASSALAAETKGVQTVALSPDGRTLVTVVAGGAIRLWDVSDPAKPGQLGQLSTATPRSYSVVFAADSRTLAICDEWTVQLWSLADPARPAQLGQPIPRGLGSPGFGAVALSADGRKLATADFRTRIQIRDVSNPAKPVEVTTDSPDPIDWLVFGADSRTLVTVTVNDTVQLWDTSDPARITVVNRSLADTSGIRINQAVPSPAGNVLATVNQENEAKLWQVSDLANSKPVPTASIPTEPTYGGIGDEAVTFGSDGQSLTIAMTAKGAHLWDLADPAKPAALALLPRPDVPGGLVNSAVLGPDKRTLVTAKSDFGVYLWRVGG